MNVAGETPDILKRILRRKAEIVAERSGQMGLPAFDTSVERASPPRGFRQALARCVEAGRAGVVAEIKQASPSKGLLREPFDPAAIARSYERGGASCLSVLTDEEFFKGADEHLQQARAATALPVLRKDFIIDVYQIYESRALGADCILLIAAALSDAALAELYQAGRELGMDVMVEVHSREELERALELRPRLVGINNRDLHSFETDVDTTIALRPLVPEEVTLITESGIHTAAEVSHLRRNGVHGFLVGEAFMRAPDPGDKLRELFGGPSP